MTTNTQLKEMLIAIDAKISQTGQLYGLATRDEVNQLRKEVAEIKEILKHSTAQ